jgi:hypothetical protein
MFVLFGSTSSLEIFPPSVIDLFLEMTVSFICIFWWTEKTSCRSVPTVWLSDTFDETFVFTSLK